MFVKQPAERTEYKPGIHGHLIMTCLRKQPQEKQTGELLATKQNGCEICSEVVRILDPLQVQSHMIQS